MSTKSNGDRIVMIRVYESERALIAASCKGVEFQQDTVRRLLSKRGKKE